MTKFVNFLTKENKTYLAEVSLGIKTDSGDMDGRVIERSKRTPSRLALEKKLKSFVGVIDQKPPIYSSLKYKGKPYRYYAAKGIEIEIKSRKVTIHSISLESFEENKFKFSVKCGPGTYIRTLAEDICESLGSLGTISTLIRTESAGFDLSQSSNIDDLTVKNLNEKIIPSGDALKCLDRIQCRPEIVEKITNGQMIEIEEAKEDGFFRFFDQKENFVGIVESYNGFLKPKRLLGNFNNVGENT
jgi:tRNA pseudouridine55 synthase